MVVRTPEGTALVVDLTSGATRRAKTELACERRRADVTLQYGDEPAEFYAGLGRYPCDRTGRETGAWTPASLAWAGEEVGGLLIVAGLETLSAYRVG